MNPAALAVLLAAALVVLAVVLSQIQARLALLEVTLNEGLPPGHSAPGARPAAGSTDAVDLETALGAGTHVFLSRTCHAFRIGRRS